MQITADLRDGAYVLTLTGAPAGSVAEVRFSNTINGVSSVELVDVKADGTAQLPTVPDYGQHVGISARILTAANHDTVQQFVYSRDSTAQRLLLVTPESLAEPSTPAPGTSHPAPAGQH